MTAHPAALVLADHALDRVRPADSPVIRGACLCGWTGPVCDHPNHQKDMLAEAGLIAGGSDGHLYLSTGCLHGDHDYCQRTVGAVGRKAPATCKFCGTPCICPCHHR